MSEQVCDDSNVSSVYADSFSVRNELVVVQSVEGFGVVYRAGVQILINFDVFLGQDVKTENTLSGAGSRAKAKLSRSYFFINFVANFIE